MSKRPTEPDSFRQAAKKAKTNPVFRTAIPRVAPTTNEPNSSRSASRSTVITLSQREDGRRRATGRYRDQQRRSSTLKDPSPDPNFETCEVSESCEVTPEQDSIQNTMHTSKTKRKRNNNNAVCHYIVIVTWYSF